MDQQDAALAAATRPLSVSATPAKGGGASDKAEKKPKEESLYSSTVRLPETPFDMRANATTKEPFLQSFWNEHQVYSKLATSNPGPIYTLHDGPPYANGDLHIGHALNKILKDFINKFQLLQGRKAKFVPGWDCHGLPIELKVLQSLPEDKRRNMTPIELRTEAAAYAKRTVATQCEQFKRYGIWADWNEPYLTLDAQYEAAQLDVFGRMVLNGHVYRGKKPVHWSPSSRTALAEAELEYPEGHTSRSIYVALPITTVGDKVPAALKEAVGQSALGIWTTTPWTIPANLAVAVNGDIVYALCQYEEEAPHAAHLPPSEKRRYLIVAKDLVATFSNKVWKKETAAKGSSSKEEAAAAVAADDAATKKAPLTVIAEVTGAQLEGCLYRHPLYDRTSPVVIGGDYITTETGTGLVHTAPGHGQEDYITGQKYGLPLLSPVDDEGKFTDEAGADLLGLSVLADGNAKVVEKLTNCGALLMEEKYAHKYPYDWRTKKPTIFRATAQWFASVDGFRDDAMKAIRGVQWVPASGEKRISAMTASRSDWCISRQRKWGVPIPVFYHIETNEPLLTKETMDYIKDIVAKEGSDAWWKRSVEELLPPSHKAKANEYRKGEDTMDVWFDSGSSWAGVAQARAGLQYPADLYLEGSDQHRGWFQSSLLTSVAATGGAPYKTVLTHGFVLDEKGQKMSKSIGNVVDPRIVMEGGKDQKKDPPYGADILRLWVASVDYSSDVMIGNTIIKQISDVYRKIRITVRFLLGNVGPDYNPETDAVAYASLPPLDRYMLHRYSIFMKEARDAYEHYNFSRFFQALQKFCVADLSSFYLDVTKDRLYIRDTNAPERRAVQCVMHEMVQGMLATIAPVLPHMAEDAWQCATFPKRHASVFQNGWPSIPSNYTMRDEEAATWDALLELKAETNFVMEAARGDKVFNGSNEARAAIYIENEDARRRVQEAVKANGVDDLRYLLIVSAANLVDSAPAALLMGKHSKELDMPSLGGKVVIGVGRGEGGRCNRCWYYSTKVGSDAVHPMLCERCVPIVNRIGFKPSLPAAAV